MADTHAYAVLQTGLSMSFLKRYEGGKKTNFREASEGGAAGNRYHQGTLNVYIKFYNKILFKRKKREIGIYSLEEIHNIPATICATNPKVEVPITSLKWPLGVRDPS